MYSFVSGKSTRIALAVLFGLAVIAALAMPPHSRARRASFPARVGKSARTKQPDYVPGDVLVRYRSDAVAKRQPQTATIESLNGQSIAVRIERFEGSDLVDGLRIAKVDPADTMEAIAALKRQPNVLYAEPNYILHSDVTVPNDPRFTEQYCHPRIGSQQAWDTQRGSSGIVVGIIDTGIDIVHQDLAANIWNNPSPGAIPGFTGDVHGYNFVDNNGNVSNTASTEDHGSHVAGIIGAVGNNGVGVVGVNWSVSLMPLRFLDASGSGSTADAIRACGYAKAQRDLWVSSGGTQGANLRVLNNSYGGGGFTNSFLDAINQLNSSGILFVAAAGNTSDDPEPDNDVIAHYPSSYNAPNVIGVANTNSLIPDGLSSSSHFGANSVHLGAPGTGILSTTPGNTYQFFSGTSMASPQVAGSAALLLAQNPNLTVQQLKNLLLYNGDVVPSLTDKTITGRRVNVFNSFQALAENDVTAPGVVTGLHINTQNGRSINIGWTASGDDGAAGQAALYQVNFTDVRGGSLRILKNALPVASGTAQAVDVKIPYRHTKGKITVTSIDNVGNQSTSAPLNVAVPFSAGDPYGSTISIPVALSTGGTLLTASQDDDRLVPYTLPFTFPYFGANNATLTISTNGNLYFSPPPHRQDPTEADDVPSSTVDLTRFKMISGLWDDLDLRTTFRADAGVYVVQPNANSIIFRWQGVPCNFNNSICTGGAPVNFEIELRSDGTIKSRYGSGNTGLFPVVGISGGEPEAYVITTHTSEDVAKDLTNAVEVTYIPTTLINPLDNAFFFTNQQYFDLLGRGADLGGLAYWSDQINQCGPTDGVCLVNRRVGVSAAFFIENEFQRTGSFVYRSYKGGLGRKPVYAEFTADRPLIVEGPNLEQTKQAYQLAFVQRPEFVAKYNGQTTASGFVDALIASIQTNSNVDLNPQRQAIIDAYNSGTDQNSSRARALRAAIDVTTFTTAEYNPSFVLMQYFGYLGRDIDQGGYDFWLGLLNGNQQGNFRGMVCSFITSTEYQQRFSDLVPHSNVDCGYLTNP